MSWFLLGVTGPIMVARLRSSLRFDPVEDITAIIQVSQGPYVVVVHPSVRANRMRELIELAKADPRAINFASSGQGSVGHLATELLANMAGFTLNHIPYKGSALCALPH